MMDEFGDGTYVTPKIHIHKIQKNKRKDLLEMNEISSEGP